MSDNPNFELLSLWDEASALLTFRLRRQLHEPC